MDQRFERAVLLPIDTWFGNAPDLRARRQRADLGALAEGLLFYDTVLMVVESSDHLRLVLAWFEEAGCLESVVRLLEAGELFFYHYDFQNPPLFDSRRGSFSLMNVKEEKTGHRQLFNKYVIGRNAEVFFRTSRKRKRFLKALEDSVVIIDAEDYGQNSKSALAFLNDENRYRLLLSELLQSLQSAGVVGHLPEPRVQVTQPRPGTFVLNSNIDLEGLQIELEGNHVLGRHTPLSIATSCTRLLWSASKMKCDLYISPPSHTFLSGVVSDTLAHSTSVRESLRELQTKVRFPDIRAEVNQGRLSAYDILKLREFGDEFRDWLHETSDLDMDMLVAYLEDYSSKAGLSPTAARLMKIVVVTAVAGSSAYAGAKIGGTEGAIIGASAGAAASEFMNMLVDQFSKGWSPRLFAAEARKRADSD